MSRTTEKCWQTPWVCCTIFTKRIWASRTYLGTCRVRQKFRRVSDLPGRLIPVCSWSRGKLCCDQGPIPKRTRWIRPGSDNPHGERGPQLEQNNVIFKSLSLAWLLWLFSYQCWLRRQRVFPSVEWTSWSQRDGYPARNRSWNECSLLIELQDVCGKWACPLLWQICWTTCRKTWEELISFWPIAMMIVYIV